MRLFQSFRSALVFFSVLLGVAAVQAQNQTQNQDGEKRIALVIGNSAYQSGALATAANDAGLIAQTLQAANFDVVGARDLDAVTLRASLREFSDKAAAAGPNTVALVYFAGHGLQFEGDNYIVPIDAKITRASDVPLQAVRVTDLTKSLASLPLKARIVILDAARINTFAKSDQNSAKSDQPLAGGLALTQPDPGAMIAFNAAPGTVGPESKAAYGAYATALAEMIKQGSLPLNDLFDRVRLRVSEITAGAEIPWHASRVDEAFLFLERTAAAPVEQADRVPELRAKPARDLPAKEAFTGALARDTLSGYEDFLASHPKDVQAKRVRALAAARREASTWQASASADTREAYWSYLHRYRHGPHAGDARRRLAHLAAAYDPPATFDEISYDVPPPPPDEIIYIERPVLYFDDPEFDLPPPPPVYFLPPRPIYFIELPPPPFYDDYELPVPIYYPVPI